MSLTELFKHRLLPVNRKEVYYTATVLPGLVCADGFRHIDKFLNLLGIATPPVRAGTASANIQFFTEYCARDSIYTSDDRRRFPSGIDTGDTPDLLLAIDDVEEPVLAGIEAKMYDVPEPGRIRVQLKRQRDVFESLKTDILTARRAEGIKNVRIVQCLLIPRRMELAQEEINEIENLKLLRWEDIRDLFAGVLVDSYFLEILKLALEQYGERVSRKSDFHTNMHNKRSGQEIYDDFMQGNYEFRFMGRGLGLDGRRLMGDIDNSDSWRRQIYQVRRDGDDIIGNGNWFKIEDFVARIKALNNKR